MALHKDWILDAAAQLKIDQLEKSVDVADLNDAVTDAAVSQGPSDKG